MMQVGIAGSARKRVRVGVLAAALALVAAAAHGQEKSATPPPAKEPPGPAAPKPARPLPPVQPNVPSLHPVPPPVATAKPPEPAGSPINFTEEIITGGIILTFTAGFVVAVTLVARFFFRLAAAKDAENFVWGDPWVRAEIARLDAEAVKETVE